MRDKGVDSKRRKRKACSNLSFNHPADPVNIVMNCFGVQRALINVISNAIESSSAEGNVVKRRHQYGRLMKNGVAIGMKDFGSGMDTETLDRSWRNTRIIISRLLSGICFIIGLDGRSMRESERPLLPAT